METTFTHDDTGLAVARLLGQELIVYPRYAKLLQKGYADLPEEYRLLTALLNTDGTTLGITQGANTANARYVAGQIAGESGRKQFITKEQVEYAAQALFGEEVEIAHQSVPVGAAPREQYRYYEEYGVYAYPEQQPIWYLPVLLDFWEVSFNTGRPEIIFVRYADSGQNAFWGPGTEPIARWEIEEQANYNSSQYRRYTVTLKEMFGEWDIEEVLPGRVMTGAVCQKSRMEILHTAFLSVHQPAVGAAKQIVHTDPVQVSQGAEHLRRHHALAAFVIGVGPLGQSQTLAHLSLGQVSIFPQIADPWISGQSCRLPYKGSRRSVSPSR